jgi:hypothetical protein
VPIGIAHTLGGSGELTSIRYGTAWLNIALVSASANLNKAPFYVQCVDTIRHGMAQYRPGVSQCQPEQSSILLHVKWSFVQVGTG